MVVHGSRCVAHHLHHHGLHDLLLLLVQLLLFFLALLLFDHLLLGKFALFLRDLLIQRGHRLILAPDLDHVRLLRVLNVEEYDRKQNEIQSRAEAEQSAGPGNDKSAEAADDGQTAEDEGQHIRRLM